MLSAMLFFGVISRLGFGTSEIGFNLSIKDNKLILQKVNPIHFTETLAIIRGLNDGEEIVAQPLIGAYSGMEINPIPYNKS